MLGSLGEMTRVAELVEQRKSDECGCPEEDWLIGLLFVTIHMEHGGGGHIFIDCGDWEMEKLVEAESIEELRVKAVDWADSIPTDSEL